MYFPRLMDLKDYDIDFDTINKFDDWLSKLRGNKRLGIRPARFAVDAKVDFNFSTNLFTIAAVKLHILKVNYDVYCPECHLDMVGSFDALDHIPGRMRCDNGHFFDPFDHTEFIELTFDLVVTPDPDSPKYKGPSTTPLKNVYKELMPARRTKRTVNVTDFKESPIGKEEIEKFYFQPDWDAYDRAYERFIKSFDADVTTKEKGDALEALSSLLLSFITFFSVDTTIHTLTNQIDITVSMKPHHKLIEFPILKVINRRMICECKNEDENVPSLWIDKLFGVINKTDHCKSGIVFSRHPFSGNDLKYARASQIEYARKGYYILSMHKADFDDIKEKHPNILDYLDKKFETLEMRIKDRHDNII